VGFFCYFCWFRPSAFCIARESYSRRPSCFFYLSATEAVKEIEMRFSSSRSLEQDLGNSLGKRAVSSFQAVEVKRKLDTTTFKTNYILKSCRNLKVI